MNNELYFSNANSRQTYFTLHNVARAHEKAKGKGVKVGVIDWLFGVNENKELYAGYADISGRPELLYEACGHGLMMAITLREIAPECEIYAINAVVYGEGGEELRLELFEKGIEWAIENGMDVLTYSHAAFMGEDRIRANDAVRRAVQNGITTTFIHNDSEYNIFPYGCMEDAWYGVREEFSRKPDLNILHFDYNSLSLTTYEKYSDALKAGEKIRSGDMIPFFSFSSMSVVLGGFAAIIKQLRPEFLSWQIRDLLVRTSYKIEAKGQNWYDINPCGRVVDIGRAVDELSV